MSQALAKRELCEGHAQILIEARETLDLVLAVVLGGGTWSTANVCVSCAKTSLPWFIGDPWDGSHRRVADTTIDVQIETRGKHELLVPLQRLTNGNSLNVRTVVVILNR